MTETGTLKQTAAAIDRQLIAGEMTRIMQDPASDSLTLEQIKQLAIENLRAGSYAALTAEIQFLNR